MLKKTIALFTMFFTFQLGNCQYSTTCFTHPEDMNQDNVISDGGFIESYCFYYISRADVISATVKHTDPEGNHTIFCTGAEGNSGKPCATEPRDHSYITSSLFWDFWTPLPVSMFLVLRVSKN